ncbi:unnamed protein product [Protopolystoma xenopodis]|uniref:Uncharacterized protein n=1 Tax=Protopolystoma xenopodis TaxID=117903 RepID=A0A3S5AQY9_9PLAT|nr:unnamed protein product [Protopolystoma xenopodis]
MYSELILLKDHSHVDKSISVTKALRMPSRDVCARSLSSDSFQPTGQFRAELEAWLKSDLAWLHTYGRIGQGSCPNRRMAVLAGLEPLFIPPPTL